MATVTPRMWTSTDLVVAEMGGGAFTTTDLAWLERVVVATDALVKQWRPELLVGTSEPVELGATKLAASMYRKRGATGGEFAEFADMSTSMLPGIIDAEIQALLGIGRHHKPVVA